MCESCEWEDLLGKIEEMRLDGDFDFADDTLNGIQDWVSEREHATEGQWNAVGNIEDSVNLRG